MTHTPLPPRPDHGVSTPLVFQGRCPVTGAAYTITIFRRPALTPAMQVVINSLMNDEPSEVATTSPGDGRAVLDWTPKSDSRVVASSQGSSHP